VAVLQTFAAVLPRRLNTLLGNLQKHKDMTARENKGRFQSQNHREVKIKYTPSGLTLTFRRGARLPLHPMLDALAPKTKPETVHVDKVAKYSSGEESRVARACGSRNDVRLSWVLRRVAVTVKRLK
jgi:hypothetical protein